MRYLSHLVIIRVVIVTLVLACCGGGCLAKPKRKDKKSKQAEAPEDEEESLFVIPTGVVDVDGVGESSITFVVVKNADDNSEILRRILVETQEGLVTMHVNNKDTNQIEKAVLENEASCDFRYDKKTGELKNIKCKALKEKKSGKKRKGKKSGKKRRQRHRLLGFRGGGGNKEKPRSPQKTTVKTTLSSAASTSTSRILSGTVFGDWIPSCAWCQQAVTYECWAASNPVCSAAASGLQWNAFGLAIRGLCGASGQINCDKYKQDAKRFPQEVCKHNGEGEILCKCEPDSVFVDIMQACQSGECRYWDECCIDDTTGCCEGYDACRSAIGDVSSCNRPIRAFQCCGGVYHDSLETICCNELASEVSSGPCCDGDRPCSSEAYDVIPGDCAGPDECCWFEKRCEGKCERKEDGYICCGSREFDPDYDFLPGWMFVGEDNDGCCPYEIKCGASGCQLRKPGYVCCGDSYIDTRFKVCCDGITRHGKVEGFECCGTEYYDTSKEICCQDRMYTTSTCCFDEGSARFCGPNPGDCVEGCCPAANGTSGDCGGGRCASDYEGNICPDTEDECQAGTLACGELEFCVIDSAGSASCQCVDGYIRSDNGKCERIHESCPTLVGAQTPVEVCGGSKTLVQGSSGGDGQSLCCNTQKYEISECDADGCPSLARTKDSGYCGPSGECCVIFPVNFPFAGYCLCYTECTEHVPDFCPDQDCSWNWRQRPQQRADPNRPDPYDGLSMFCYNCP